MKRMKWLSLMLAAALMVPGVSAFASSKEVSEMTDAQIDAIAQSVVNGTMDIFTQGLEVNDTSLITTRSAVAFEMDKIKKIVLDSSTTDIEVRESKDGKINIVAHSTDVSPHSLKTQIKDEVLTVTDVSTAWHEKVTIELPKGKTFLVKLTIGTGDIDIEGGNFSLLDCTSSAGSISVSKSTVKKAVLKSKTGDIEIQASKLADVKADTTAGSIEIATNVISPKIVVTSSTGDVDIQLPAKASVSYAIKTTTGAVSMRDKSAKKSGKLGAGKGTIKATTTAGDVDISLK